MFKDLLKVLLSPWALVYLSFFPAGRRLIRRTAKGIIHCSYDLADAMKSLRSTVPESPNTPGPEATKRSSFGTVEFEKDIDETRLSEIEVQVA